MTPDFKHIENHIRKCLATDIVTVIKAEPVNSGSGCDVVDCSFMLNGRPSEGILKIFKEGFDDYSEIGVTRTARKNVLAANELTASGIHIPVVMGYYLAEQTSAILYEKLVTSEWNSEKRVEAAKVLGHFHNITLEGLSDDLRKDITDSKSNKDRVRYGVIYFPDALDKNKPAWREFYPQLSRDTDEIKNIEEPVSAMNTLVHGDFFSANLLPVKEKLYIIDWDLLALGDPMWDLGFLVGADKDLEEEEVNTVLEEYRKYREIDDEILKWHTRCWNTYFKLRELFNSIG